MLKLASIYDGKSDVNLLFFQQGLVDPNGRSRAGRFFDTYVTHLPPPMMEPEPVIPMMNYYPGAGMIPPGYAMFHPFDLGLPLNFSPDGGAIYCPREYVYDGYMDPFEYGICFVHSHGYYK